MTDRRPLIVLVVAAALGLLLTGCASTGAGTAGAGSSGPDASAGGMPTTVPAGKTPVTDAPVAGRARLAGFKEVTVTVVDAAGRSHTVCLLLADTDAARERGLMYVEDPELGGYDGMLFAFPEDSSGGFWMKNTILPLSIAYLAADGTTVTTTDMAPCPASASTCPTYPAGGSYRWAIEVPQGRLGDLGISDRSTITVGATSCAAPSSTSSVPTRS